MSDRVTVACPGGHQIQTAVRGRSTTCPRCRRRVYVRADGTTRHGRPKNTSGASGRSSAPSWPLDRADRGRREAKPLSAGPAAEPFNWGRRRWDEEPAGAEFLEYDPRADRTKLFDASDEYMGWMAGDPYGLAEEMELSDG
jgi:hypothetical protein